MCHCTCRSSLCPSVRVTCVTPSMYIFYNYSPGRTPHSLSYTFDEFQIGRLKVSDFILSTVVTVGRSAPAVQHRQWWGCQIDVSVTSVIDCVCHLGPPARWVCKIVSAAKCFQLIPMKKMRPQDRIHLDTCCHHSSGFVDDPSLSTVPQNSEVIAIGVKCRTLKNVTKKRFSESRVD